MIIHAEFTVEPFVAGVPGEHVTEALNAARQAGVEVEFGPFGTAANGEGTKVIGAVSAAVQAAFEHGAERVSVQFSTDSAR